MSVIGGKIDILFVVDPSGSMSNEQTLLQNSFSAFIDNFSQRNLDFHVGVIATDSYNTSSYFSTMGFLLPGTSWQPGMLLAKNSPNRFLTSASTDLVESFKNNVKLGTGGAGAEAGVHAIINAIKPAITQAGAPNAGFMRPDARLSVIVVSDEDDAYNDNGNLGTGYTRTASGATTVKARELADAFAIAKPGSTPGSIDTSQVRLDVVVGDKDGEFVYNRPGDPTSGRVLDGSGGILCRLNSELSVDLSPSGSRTSVLGTGDFYKELAQQYRGRTIDLCKGDFSDDLNLLGSDIAADYQKDFVLKFRPINVGSIRVTINGIVRTMSATNGWTYDSISNQVTLHGMNLDSLPNFLVQFDYTYMAP